ncbi:hypothetical protein E4U47_000711 [Claviceps purpurea]|nr:hypothetical protein E4U47_000711 [Claviceps purpurea]
MAENESAPPRSSDNCDDERSASLSSSTGLQSADLTKSNLQSTICSTSGYERIGLDNEDTDDVSKESAVSQSKSMRRSSSKSLYPDRMASCNDIGGQQTSESPERASPHASPRTTHSGTNFLDSPPSEYLKGRHAWKMAPTFSRVFQRFGTRAQMEQRAETLREHEASLPNETPNDASPPYHDTTQCHVSLHSETDIEHGDDNFDDEAFSRRYCEKPSYCSSRSNAKVAGVSWIPMTILALSIYSTVMSGMWLVVSFIQPGWGHKISSNGSLQPSTATMVTALLAKTIELSFVTVFVSLLGQMITHKSLIRYGRSGMTLAEITMRNWVIQPGSLMTHWESVPYAGFSMLGGLTLIATIISMLYTTASDAMVAPKLMNTDWQKKTLSGPFDSIYANVNSLKTTCPDMFGSIPRDESNDIACMQIQFAGQSHRNLFSFMSTWADMKANDTSIVQELKDRPTGKHSLYENITMTAAWIHTDYGNVTASSEKHGRIVNNVTMAMPHPGVYAAATAPENNIMQPADLAGVGEYTILAGVVSPTVNVMCVNMNREELAPLVYSEWPDSDLSLSKTEAWIESIPPILSPDQPEYFNRTMVDEIFRWGPEFKRRPPIFPLFPIEYNMVSSPIVNYSDSIYVLANRYKIKDDLTLCEMRSWLSPFCHTEFNSSGTSGTSMRAMCEDPDDINAYYRSFPPDTIWTGSSPDWTHVAVEWSKALGLHGGNRNSNNSNAHQLTQLALKSPNFLPDQPSLAEALAVFAGSTLVAGSIKAPFRHYWDTNSTHYRKDKVDSFSASLKTQQYTSGHVLGWQTMFYIVLAPVFFINFACLILIVRILLRSTFVTDFTEPQNLFTLAMNSPPTTQIKGSCGGGPKGRDLVVPWRVAYASIPKHYFLMEANESPWRGKYANSQVTTDALVEEDDKAIAYIRLSQGKGLM